MKEQDTTHENRIVLITNDERRMIVHALGVLENAVSVLEPSLSVDEGVTYDSYKESVRRLAHVFCEENWMPQYHINSYKVRTLDEV